MNRPSVLNDADAWLTSVISKCGEKASGNEQTVAVVEAASSFTEAERSALAGVLRRDIARGSVPAALIALSVAAELKLKEAIAEDDVAALIGRLRPEEAEWLTLKINRMEWQATGGKNRKRVR